MTGQLDLADLLRDAGMATVLDAEPEEYRVKAEKARDALIRTGRPWTVEDIRRVAGSPAHPSVMGALLSAWAKAGLVRLVGYTKPSRPSRRGNRIAQWVGAS